MTSMNFANINGHCFPLRSGQSVKAEPDEDMQCIHCGVSYMGTGPTCNAPCRGPRSRYYYHKSGHVFVLRERENWPGDAEPCVRCGVPFAHAKPPTHGVILCSPMQTTVSPRASIARYPNATLSPEALCGVSLNGKNIARYDSIPPDGKKLVQVELDYETWANVKNGGQTAMLLAAEEPLRGPFEISAGVRQTVECRVTRCFLVGQLAPPGQPVLPLWLVCLKNAAHAERRREQKRALRRLSKAPGAGDSLQVEQLKRLLRVMTNERDEWRAECRKARGEQP